MLSRKKNYFLLICLFFLFGCAGGGYQSVSSKMDACGFKQDKFSSFSECLKENVKHTKLEKKDSYYNVLADDIHLKVDELNKQVSKKKLSEKNAYNQIDTFVNQRIVEDEKNKQAFAVSMAVLAGGVALASCANNGCGGGGYNSYNNTNHQGCCSHHNGIKQFGGIAQCTASNQIICNDNWVSSCACN